MTPRILVFTVAAAGTLACASPHGAAAATIETFVGMAVVTAATSACDKINRWTGKWTVGRELVVNYREALDATHERVALRFSDATFTLVATQRPNTFWTSPTGAPYDAEVSGTNADVTMPVNFSGQATLQLWTSTAVPNARYMYEGKFTNWAQIAGCTLTLRATMIRR